MKARLPHVAGFGEQEIRKAQGQSQDVNSLSAGQVHRNPALRLVSHCGASAVPGNVVNETLSPPQKSIQHILQLCQKRTNPEQ